MWIYETPDICFIGLDYSPALGSPKTPPLEAIDEALPWNFEPLRLDDTAPERDLWELFDPYEYASTVPLSDPTPLYSAPSPHILTPASSLPSFPSSKKLDDNLSPALSSEAFEALLSSALQYTTVPEAPTPSSIQPIAHNFDHSMSALANVAALFKLGLAAGVGAQNAESTRRENLRTMIPEVPLVDIWLNEPTFSM